MLELGVLGTRTQPKRAVVGGDGGGAAQEDIMFDWSDEDPSKRRRVIVDPLDETEIRGEGWRVEVEREGAGRGRGVKRRRAEAVAEEGEDDGGGAQESAGEGSGRRACEPNRERPERAL